MSFASCGSEGNSSFSVIRTGRLDDWRDYVFEHPKVPITSGKLFLKELLNLSGMEISVNRLAPGEGIPFRHKHRENEEVYIFVRGRGQFQVDGEVFDVEEGSVVRVAPAGVRRTGIIPPRLFVLSLFRRRRDHFRGRVFPMVWEWERVWNGRRNE